MKIIITDLNQPQYKSSNRRFGDWIKLKDNLHATGETPRFKEGDIWWAALGDNVGIEINGKNERFSRPILILKKLGNLGFMAVPLTSQFHEGSWYLSFTFRGIIEYAVLSQARVCSAQRLYKNMGQISKSELRNIRLNFCRLYGK